VEAERKILATSTRPVNTYHRRRQEVLHEPEVDCCHFCNRRCAAIAQAQPPSTAKVIKADAQKVIKIISGDKAKAQTYCQIGKLGEQIEEANDKKDSKTADELSQKMKELVRLGDWVQLSEKV
jgi:hypothetical protein